LNCPTREKLLDKIVFGSQIDEQTDQYIHPEEHKSAQNNLGLHLISCDNEKCVQMKKDRIEYFIMNEKGVYLK